MDDRSWAPWGMLDTQHSLDRWSNPIQVSCFAVKDKHVTCYIEYNITPVEITEIFKTVVTLCYHDYLVV